MKPERGRKFGYFVALWGALARSIERCSWWKTPTSSADFIDRGAPMFSMT